MFPSTNVWHPLIDINDHYHIVQIHYCNEWKLEENAKNQYLETKQKYLLVTQNIL